MSKVYQTILFVLLISLTTQVHVKSHQDFDSQKYLEALQSKQAALQAGVNDLDQSISGVDSSLSQYDDIKSKIGVLQNAIFDQQKKVFNLSTEMIPPLNLSTCNCQQLDPTQKEQLQKQAQVTLDKVKQLKLQIVEMSDLDPNDLRVKQMKRDIQAQIFYLEKISTVLDSNCTQQAVIAPSVFQSNMYAPNWILGNQTINDLVGSYVQRTKDYDHITNCPLQLPFYNGQECIQCEQPSNLFNMETKQCVACSQGTIFSQLKRQCVKNTTSVTNIFTHLPWITQQGNFTNTMNKYSKILEDKATYDLCPTETPFLINGDCSKCQQLNQAYSLQIEKCVVAKEGMQYDPNVHSIVSIQDYQETFPNATNIISVKNLPDIQQIQNCPEQKPYYDGIACIKCQEPFNLFDVGSKKCIACDPETIYNPEKRICQNRDFIYGLSNGTNLLGTPSYLVSDYQKQINDLASSNPDAINIECQQENSYSIGDKCVTCAKGEYFLVAKKECGKCQNIDLKNQYCLDDVVIIPYWEMINCRIIGQDTDAYKQNIINKTQQDPNNVFNCPIQKPFTDGNSCFSCPSKLIFFDIEKNQCVSCPTDFEYDCSIHQCIRTQRPPLYLPNQQATRYVGQNQGDVSQFLDNLANSTNGYPNLQTCPQDKPYAGRDGKQCFACLNPKVFNINTNQCVSCPNQTAFNSKTYTCQFCLENQKYNAETQLCDAKLFIINTSTGSNIVGEKTQDAQDFINKQNQALKTNPLAQSCPQQKPYTDGQSCFNCEGQTPLFNVNTKSCSKCDQNTFYISDQFICSVCKEEDNRSYNTEDKACQCNQGYQINNQNDLKCIPICQEGKEYQKQFDSCVAICPQGVDRNLDTLKCCSQGQFYNTVSKACEVTVIVCPDGQSFNAQQKKCIQNIVPTCQIGQQYNQQTKQCESICQAGETYNAEKKICQHLCKLGQVYDENLKQCIKLEYASNLQANENWIAQNPEDFMQKNQQYAKQHPQKVCPSQTPFWNGNQCITCQQNEYFNEDTKKCIICPAGTQFNVFTHQCRGKQNYITNPNTTNLVYDGFSKGQLDYYYQQNKTANPNMQDCPVQTPFFNGDLCIICPQETPYFSFAYRVCGNCPEGSKYNEKKHQCLNASGQSIGMIPTIQSLAANVLAHRKMPLNIHNNHKAKKLHHLQSA